MDRREKGGSETIIELRNERREIKYLETERQRDKETERQREARGRRLVGHGLQPRYLEFTDGGVEVVVLLIQTCDAALELVVLLLQHGDASV